MHQISTQMHAESPMLVVSDKVRWRVPLHLTFPAFGDVGCVGYLYLDPITGEVDASLNNIEEITNNAETLASRFTSTTTYTG